MGSFTIIPVTKFGVNKVVQYSYCLDASPKPREPKPTDQNLTRGQFNGYLSQKTKGKLFEWLSNWIISADLHRKQKHTSTKVERVYFTFATLTLPAKQSHTDNEIKRDCLNHLIIKLQREAQVTNYFWRAEPQKNGNIHFHLILDKFIPNTQLQKAWNYVLDGHGYISRFRKVYGHSNPPTTHIVKLNSHKDAIKYVSKYLSKGQDRRKIEGRLWGCSDLVRQFASIPFETTVEMNQLVNKLAEKKDTYKITGQYFACLFNDVYDIMEKETPHLWRYIAEKLVSHFLTCYQIDEPQKVIDEPPKPPPNQPVTKYIQLRINGIY
jgi:hypothetical protein